MCGPRKYPYLPHGRVFSMTARPLLKFQLGFMQFFKCFGLREPPTPRKIPCLLWGEYGTFLEPHNGLHSHGLLKLLMSYSD